MNTFLPRKQQARLLRWRSKSRPRPLVLRGPRQVGKSTLVRQLGRDYQQYIELNLEREADRQLFEKLPEVGPFLAELFVREDAKPALASSTLLFIDEIQQAPNAIQFLRYLYEDQSDVHVIAAGSLLEFALGEVRSMPVGRVEFMAVHPLTFREYLVWMGKEQLVDALDVVPAPAHAEPYLREAFRDFALTGGMPSVVASLAAGADSAELYDLYEGIWDSYRTDLERHAKSDKQRDLFRFLLLAAPFELERFSYARFGGSDYPSREVKEALGQLQMARILRVVRPTTSMRPPALPNVRAKPRLQFLDVGLLNFLSGLLRTTTKLAHLSDAYRGQLAAQVVTQELIASQDRYSYEPYFWVREKRTSNAEVDLVYQDGMRLLGFEVKAGAQGRLRSLHQYVERSGTDIAIRALENAPEVADVTTPGGYAYRLLNIPHYATAQLDEYLTWAKSV